MGYVGAYLRDSDASNAVGEAIARGLGGRVTYLHPRTEVGSLVVVASPDVQVAKSHDGSFGVLDGEIHSDLSGRPPSLQSLIHTFANEGANALGQLDANGGLTLFDADSGRVVAARDAVGNGSMFVCTRSDGVFWSPRLRELRAAVGASQVDWRAVDFYISRGFVPSPWTMYRNIERLGPGELVEISGASARRIRFHDFTTKADDQDAGSLYGVLHEQLPASVRDRVGDLDETGVLLSGGVDSQLMLALITTEFGKAPKTFTFEYEGYEGPINEGDRARASADHFGSEHTLLRVSPQGLIDRLPGLLDSTAEPLARTIHTVLVDGVHDHDVTTLITGVGADSLYLNGGDRKALAIAALPGPLRTAVAGGAGSLMRTGRIAGIPYGSSKNRAAPTFINGFARAAGRAQAGLNVSLEAEFLPLSLREDTYRDPDRAVDGEMAFLDLVSTERTLLDDLDPSDQLRVLELRFDSADDLLRRDLDIAQANGLTFRSPFFSLGLMTRWMQHSVPTSASLRRTNKEWTKADIRKFATTVLPTDMAYAPKRGHSVPVHLWLRGPLLPWLKEVTTTEELRKYGVFDPAAVHRMIDLHASGQGQFGWALWTIACLGLWFDQLDRAQPAWVDDETR